MDSGFKEYGIWGLFIVQVFQLLGGLKLGEALAEWIKMKAGSDNKVQELEKKLLVLETEKKLMRSHGKKEKVRDILPTYDESTD